jgi:cytochrome b6-f complex iron-sulfur subunit
MTEPKKKSSIDRRKFLGLAWTGSMALLFGQAAVAAFNFIQPVSKGGFGGLIYAGKVEEFLLDSVNRIMAGRFFLSRTEGGVIALWQKCTHLGCAVPWVEEEGQFHCPCHGSLFNRHGEVTGGPAPRPMDIFPVSINKDEVWVDTSKPIERTEFDPSQLTKL